MSKAHFSIPDNQRIFRNFSKENGFRFTIRVPYAYFKEVNEVLRTYHARLGYDHDKYFTSAFGFWFDSEEYYNWFILKYS